MHIRSRYKHLGDHVHVKVFVGEDDGHLALSGKLCFRKNEWNIFSLVLSFGAGAFGELFMNEPVTTDKIDERLIDNLQETSEVIKEKEVLLKNLSESPCE